MPRESAFLPFIGCIGDISISATRSATREYVTLTTNVRSFTSTTDQREKKSLDCALFCRQEASLGHRITFEVMPDGHIAVHTGLGGREHEYPEDIYALVPGCRKPPQLPAQLQRRRNVTQTRNLVRASWFWSRI